MLVSERCIEAMRMSETMLTATEVKTLCKLSETQWQMLRRAPGRPEPTPDGRSPKYHPHELATHFLAYNALQLGQSIRQLAKTFVVARATMESWRNHEHFPKSLGVRYGHEVFSVEQVDEFVRTLTRGLKWRKTLPTIDALKRRHKRRRKGGKSQESSSEQPSE